MIYLSFGSNLNSKLGTSRFIISKSYSELTKFGIRIVKKSFFYKSKAYPNPKDPEFVNTVISVESRFHVRKLLDIILKVEKKFGRVRSKKNAPRVLDIDIIDFHSRNINNLRNCSDLIVPHSRVADRLFVLIPLLDVACNWKNSRTGKHISYLVTKIQKHSDNKITKI